MVGVCSGRNFSSVDRHGHGRVPGYKGRNSQSGEKPAVGRVRWQRHDPTFVNWGREGISLREEKNSLPAMKIYILFVSLLFAITHRAIAQQKTSRPGNAGEKKAIASNEYPDFDHYLLLETHADTTANVSFGDF